MSNQLELLDSQTAYLDTDFLSRNVRSRNVDAITAKLGHQFIHLNRDAFRQIGVHPEIYYTGDAVKLKLISGTQIGAVPLWSPVTYKPEFSLIIRPRFGWQGIGPVLSTTGWRILPSILNLPQLKISERRVPPWVLSSVVLSRLEQLIYQLSRRFEMTEQYKTAPKGTVNWTDYARTQIPNGRFLNLNCRFPELQDDMRIKAMIHFALLKQKESLTTQREHGVHVLQLLDYCNSLIQHVTDAYPERPTRLHLEHLQSSSFQIPAIHQGVEAINWTVEEKGLAGLGDLHGLPWTMSMETLFESYVEALVAQWVRKSGGTLRSGLQRETIMPLQWDPPFTGSQRYMLPDVMVERDDHLHIFDAKYKDHWEDLNTEGWHNFEEEIRSRHREDLLQILAYASVPEHKHITCCLVYPCRKETWESLVERDRHVHRAEVAQADRRIELELRAVPFGVVESTIGELINFG